MRPTSKTFHIADCSEYVFERYVALGAYSPKGLYGERSPELYFAGIGGVASKGGYNCALEAYHRHKYYGGDDFLECFGGGNLDHAALAELRHLGNIIDNPVGNTVLLSEVECGDLAALVDGDAVTVNGRSGVLAGRWTVVCSNKDVLHGVPLSQLQDQNGVACDAAPAVGTALLMLTGQANKSIPVVLEDAEFVRILYDDRPRRRYRHTIALGDDFHKLALVGRALSSGAFGNLTGVGEVSMVQHLFQMHNIQQRMVPKITAVMSKFMGRPILVFPASNLQRWDTVGIASGHHSDLEQLQRLDHRGDVVPGEYAVPHMYRHVEESHSGVEQTMAREIAVQSQDLRCVPSPLLIACSPFHTQQLQCEYVCVWLYPR
jgi:hypothetical protein